MSTAATFFSVGDERYFPGTVAMVNSLRLTGHTEEIVILDGGFSAAQLEVLSRECTVLPLPDSAAASNPTYYKLIAPATHHAKLPILIDGDMIVTGRFDPLVEAAAAGKVVAYADPDEHRWFAQWRDIYDLPAEPRRQPYVCAGLVAFSQDHYPDLLPRWIDACEKTRDHPTIAEGARGPTSQADQDALNALLMSCYPEGAVHTPPAWQAPQAHELEEGVDVLDADTLRCEYSGHPTVLLHAAGKGKPWTRRGVKQDAYTTLLRRLLSRDDVATPVPAHLVPTWLQYGRRPDAALAGLAIANRAALGRRRATRRLRNVARRVLKPQRPARTLSS